MMEAIHHKIKGEKTMNNLKQRESVICKLADTDPIAAKALRLMAVRFDDAGFAHAFLIGAIYIERRSEHVWQLALRGHISESTAYRYRRRYIETFYRFYRKLLENRPGTDFRAANGQG